MLKIEHLTKDFSGKVILKNITLTVKPGEIAVLLGKSGSGKSTLLRILNNLEIPTAGTIILNGRQLDPQRLSQEHAIGMVFQHFNLFSNMNVITNITFPLEKVLHKTPDEARSIAQKLLKEYELEDLAFVPVARLSGGQKQRLAIVRTIALKPLVVCLDEPTSALDPFLSSFVAQNITNLAEQGYILLVATHDMHLIEKLDCTIHFIQDGSIALTVASKEFFKDPRKFIQLSSFVKGHVIAQ